MRYLQGDREQIWIRANSVPSVVAEADLTKGLHLPFKDKAFDKVEVYFPDDELLYNLCGHDNGLLWCDLGRVLKDNGVVDITIVKFW